MTPADREHPDSSIHGIGRHDTEHFSAAAHRT
jgi:hypothetical protein